MKRLRYKKGRLSDLIQNFYFYAMPIACRASYRQMNFVNTVVVTQDVIAWRLTNYFEYASNLPESVANVVGVFSDANCNEHCTTLCRYPLMREKCLIQPSPLSFEWTGINLFALRTSHPVRVSRSHAFIALARG